MTNRAFDTPETQDPLRPVCLATSVRYVMKQDTVIRSRKFALVRHHFSRTIRLNRD
jgi:hypothetical protein